MVRPFLASARLAALECEGRAVFARTPFGRGAAGCVSRPFCFAHMALCLNPCGCLPCRSGCKQCRTAPPAQTLVVIVAFRNSDDVIHCFEALDKIAAPDGLTVLVCENRGADAFERLVSALATQEAVPAIGPRGRSPGGSRFPPRCILAIALVGRLGSRWRGARESRLRRRRQCVDRGYAQPVWLERRLGSQSQHGAGAAGVAGADRLRPGARQRNSVEPRYARRRVRAHRLARSTLAAPQGSQPRR